MKKLTLLLIAISLLASSCKKDDPTKEETTNGSITMTYDGQTYTGAETASLRMVDGNIAVAGTSGKGYLLTISGVGSDGSTTNICTSYTECDNMCTVTLDWGAAEGLEGMVATSGTVKRTGKTIEVDVTGNTTSLEDKSLKATIVLNSVIDL